MVQLSVLCTASRRPYQSEYDTSAGFFFLTSVSAANHGDRGAVIDSTAELRSRSSPVRVAADYVLPWATGTESIDTNEIRMVVSAETSISASNPAIMCHSPE